MNSITDWIQAVSSIITVILGVWALIFAIQQISQITAQIRSSVLTNVLSLESEMKLRKEKVDDITHEINISFINANFNGKEEDYKEAYKLKLEAAIENWLNSIDRLCFCIRRNFFDEKDWKLEYRDFIKYIIESFEYKFGAGTKYNNILELNQKWSKE